jgi:N-formylglutamate deformylase
MDAFTLHPPAHDPIPLLVTVPHTGTAVPPAIAERWSSPEVGALPDTDWHLDRLYDFVPRLGAALMVARYSRYVIDLNRPADGHALYPGRSETGLVPTTTFSNQPLYRPGLAPDAAEVTARIARYWTPWHRTVREQLDALKARFGYAILFDAHSIISDVPRFSAERLPGLMLGTADGRSCSPALAAAAMDVFSRSPYAWQLNAPFKGGYITRSFGAPDSGIHAIQLEMSQRLYMAEGPPFTYLPERAAGLRTWLEETLRAIAAQAP